MKLVTALFFVNVNYDIEMIVGDRTAVGHLSLLVIVYLYDLYDRGVEDRDSLHTMPGSCYLTPVWDISILYSIPPPPPIALAPMLSYPTELLFMTTTTTTVQLKKLSQTTII